MRNPKIKSEGKEQDGNDLKSKKSKDKFICLKVLEDERY